LSPITALIAQRYSLLSVAAANSFGSDFADAPLTGVAWLARYTVASMAPCFVFWKGVYQIMLFRITLSILVAGSCLAQNAARMDQIVQS